MIRTAGPNYRETLEAVTDYFRRFDTSKYPPIEVGQVYVFAYPDFGEPVAYPEYLAHRYYFVTVLQQIQAAAVDGEQEASYKVRADDGWEGEAFDSELFPMDLAAYSVG